MITKVETMPASTLDLCLPYLYVWQPQACPLPREQNMALVPLEQDSSELLCQSWESNLGPLGEQPAFNHLTVSPSLRALGFPQSCLQPGTALYLFFQVFPFLKNVPGALPAAMALPLKQ